MSQSPYVPSPLTTPRFHSTPGDPSIAIVDDYSSNESAFLPTPFFPSTHSLSPLHSRKVDLMEGVGGLAGAAVIKPERDMNFAHKDSTAAKAGIQTPLAQYTAQMVVWLWFGRTDLPNHSPDGSIVSDNPFDYPLHPANPLNPLQVIPSPTFTKFVAELLQITMVSHSVTLVALLYIYRLKKRYIIEATSGTEMRPFIASLILSNKYLDDNTYTNKTWADLTGLPVAEIGKMEAEFLRGLNYGLAVEKSDYDIWLRMLDGFILSRSHQSAYRSRYNPDYTCSPPNPATSYIPHTPYIPSPDVRARSVSPIAHGSQYGYARKRSAIDAFAGDHSISPLHTQARRTNGITHQPVPRTSSGLARSTSLNRQIARLGSASGSRHRGRRGSAGVSASFQMSHGDDLRHMATNHAAQMAYGQDSEAKWEWLIAPCEEQPEAHAIPPEQLVFYTISAEAHPGQDGAPRKAILRHQEPHPYSYPPHSQPFSTIGASGPSQMLAYHPSNQSVNFSPHTAYTPSNALYPSPLQSYPANDPHSRSSTDGTVGEPGTFADAGPPGYLYDPASYAAGQPAETYYEQEQRQVSNTNRWSTTSEEMMAYTHAHGLESTPSGQQWRTRSEWSSPMPGYEGWRPSG